MRDASPAHGWGPQTARTTTTRQVIASPATKSPAPKPQPHAPARPCPCLSFCHPRRGPASRPHRRKHPHGPPPPGRVTASPATKRPTPKPLPLCPERSRRAGVQAQPKRLNCLPGRHPTASGNLEGGCPRSGVPNGRSLPAGVGSLAFGDRGSQNAESKPQPHAPARRTPLPFFLSSSKTGVPGERFCSLGWSGPASRPHRHKHPQGHHHPAFSSEKRGNNLLG